MTDEHDVTASSMHPPSVSDIVFDEGQQRRLDLHIASASQSRAIEREFAQDKYIAYTIKLPAHQLAALQSIWLELKRLYGAHSPDKSGMIQHAVEEWLKRWDGPDRDALLDSLLQIRADTRRRQYKK